MAVRGDRVPIHNNATKKMYSFRNIKMGGMIQKKKNMILKSINNNTNNNFKKYITVYSQNGSM